MSNICLFKLINGEDVIALCDDLDIYNQHPHYVIHHPVKVLTVPTDITTGSFVMVVQDWYLDSHAEPTLNIMKHSMVTDKPIIMTSDDLKRKYLSYIKKGEENDIEVEDDEEEEPTPKNKGRYH